MKRVTIPATPHLQMFIREMDRLRTLALAAGKDFNDELTLILNHAEVTLGLLGAEHPAGPELIEVRHATLRCAETVRGLLRVASRVRIRSTTLK